MGLTSWRVVAGALGCFVAVSALRADDESHCHSVEDEGECNDFADCLWDDFDDLCVFLDIKITELMIESDSRGDGSHFVELLNRGDSVRMEDVVLEGIFNGIIRNLSLFEMQEYLVIYDGQAGEPRCESCDCYITGPEHHCVNAVYVKCCSDSDECDCQFNAKSVNNRKWQQSLTIYGADKEIDSLEFDPRSMPQINQGYGSFLLDPMTSDNQMGRNWMQTCNTQGTPGSQPFHLGDCKWICTDEECKLNSAMHAFCVHHYDADDYCDCTADDGYYYEESLHTCMNIPLADECEAVWTSDDTGVKHLHYSWVPPMIDMEVNYSLEYHSTTGLRRILTMATSQDVYDHADETAAVLGSVRTIIGEHISEAEDCVGGVSPTADEGTTTKESDSSSSSNHNFPVWAIVLIALLLLTALVGGILAYKFWWLKRVQTPSGGLYEPFSDHVTT